MSRNPNDVFNGDIQTVMTRLLKQCGMAMMEAWDLVDAEAEDDTPVADYYRVLSKMHDPLCAALEKIKEASFMHTMIAGNENPLAGVPEKINQELNEAFAKIMEEED